MAAITLTATQAELAFILIKQATDALIRHGKITEYDDAQCQVLIDAAKKTKASLDARLAGHFD